MAAKHPGRRGLYLRVWQRLIQRTLNWMYRRWPLVLGLVVAAILGSVFLVVRANFEAQAAAVGEFPVEVAAQTLQVRGNNLPSLNLKEKNGERTITIPLREAEALTILVEQGQLQAELPLVYDLTSSLLRELGGRVDRVIVSDRNQAQYIANVVLSSPIGETRVVQAQPADGVTLAIKTGAPIFVENRILDQFTRR